MALDVSAPKNGYNTDAKQKYREDVWSCLIPAWELCKYHDNAHVLIMPSREGLEIDHLISLGVPQERIVAIDKSAAVIATSIWRKKFPKVKFFTTSVGDAYKKINASNIIICAANLDFCSNFCESLIDEYRRFRTKTNQFECARIACTIAKGREGKALVSMIKKFAPHLDQYNEPRCAALLSCSELDNEHMLWGQGDYVSGKNPMSWFVVSRSYIISSETRRHISDLNSLDIAECANRVRKMHPTWMSKKAVEDWLSTEIAKPFMKTIESEIKLSGGVLVKRMGLCQQWTELNDAVSNAISKIFDKIYQDNLT